jgi:hypothetical protein
MYKGYNIFQGVKRSVSLLVLMLTMICAPALSQILTFDLAGYAGTEGSAASNSNDVNLAASSLTRGSGITSAANADRLNGTNWTTSASIDANDYMEFIVSPNAGYQFSISSVVVQLQRSGTGPRAIEIRSSNDTYASALGSGTISDLATTQSFTFTFAQPNSASAVTYRVYLFNSEASTGTGGIGDGAGNDLVVNGIVSPIAVIPTITVSTTTLSGFNYAFGSGPSAEQTFTCSGSNLTTDITLNAPADYEISLSAGAGFGTSLTLSPGSGTVSATTIYVHLKAGLAGGTYNGQVIDITSTGAASKTVTLSGTVSVIVTGVLINEILVNPSDANDGSNAPNTSEWVELYNSTGSAVDISCWFITDGDFAVTFPSGTTIASGDYFTMASATGSGESPDLDWSACGCTSGLTSQVGIFTNGNEQLLLYDNNGNLVDAIIWGIGQLPGSITTTASGSCSSVAVTFPAAGSFENIGTISDGVANERDIDGSNTWQQTASPTFDASNGVITLPIELISFIAELRGINEVELNWTTASETNNDHFTIERSADGIEFFSLITVKGAGNSNAFRKYSTFDKDPLEHLNYYRLKQTDYDGKISYSEIIPVNVGKKNLLVVYPNPATEILNFRIAESSGTDIIHEIRNIQGLLLSGGILHTSKNNDFFTLGINELPPGTYMLRLITQQNTKQSIFIKQ